MLKKICVLWQEKCFNAHEVYHLIDSYNIARKKKKFLNAH